MLITFDLDGVIADSDRWFFSMFNVLGELAPLREQRGELFEDTKLVEQYRIMEIDYYKSRPLKHHPNLFMADDDIGYIITARKPHAKKVTEDWLKRYGIILPVIYADLNGDINWWEYEKASTKAAEEKARVIKSLRFTDVGSIHFDNNPFIVKELRKAGVPTVLVGGVNE